MVRYYPEITDNDWRDQCGQIATQANFAEYSKARRLELIQLQEAMDHGMTRCPLFTRTWADAIEGPLAFYPSASPSPGARYFFRGPYDPDCVWNILLSILDIGNALRSMSIEDQDRYKFQMFRVLSVTRLLEARCQGLFTGLIDAQRCCAREKVAKKKKARKSELASMDPVVTE